MSATVSAVPTGSFAPAASRERLSFRTVFTWAIGNMGGNLAMSSIIVLALPIYNVALGVDVVKLGWALSLPRIIDVFFDPLVGWISDNTNSRWGRRRPFIVAGTIPLALLTLLLWMPPTGTTTDTLFWYFLGVSIFYYLAFSICTVPFYALGYELSDDYNERTRVMAWSYFLNLAGAVAAPWLYRLTLLPIFGRNEVVGVRWVGGLIAVVLFCTFIIPGLFCRERGIAVAKDKIGLFDAFRQTVRNVPFRYLITAGVITTVVIFMGTPCLFYINVFEVCGSKELAGKVLGWGGSVQVIGAFAGVLFSTRLSKWIGKRMAMIVCLAITILGFATYTVTLTPQYPYLQLVSNFLIGVGIVGAGLMSSTMMIDVCDDDELKTGHRREAFYASTGGVAGKGGLAIAALFSGYLIRFAGYHENVTPDAKVMASMRHVFIWSQILGLAVCALIVWFYPLTRKRMAEIRAELDKRHSHGLA